MNPVARYHRIRRLARHSLRLVLFSRCARPAPGPPGSGVRPVDPIVLMNLALPPAFRTWRLVAGGSYFCHFSISISILLYIYRYPYLPSWLAQFTVLVRPRSFTTACVVHSIGCLVILFSQWLVLICGADPIRVPDRPDLDPIIQNELLS